MFGCFARGQDEDPEDPFSGPLADGVALVSWLFPQREEEKVKVETLAVLDRGLVASDAVARADAPQVWPLLRRCPVALALRRCLAQLGRAGFAGERSVQELRGAAGRAGLQGW